MLNQNFSDRSYNDIIFQGRNKAYGAYALREAYSANLRKAGGIVLLALLPILLFSFRQVNFNSKVEIKQHDSVKVTVVTITKKPQIKPIATLPKPAQPAPKPKAIAQKPWPTRIVEDKKVTTPLISNTIIALMDDDTTGIGTAPISMHFNVGKTGNNSTTSTEKPNNKPFVSVERMPQFPGGESAMLDFLSKHVHYTNAASSLELEGKVVLNFIVDEQGQISQIEVARSLGGGLDQEAIEAVKKMPKWSPGIQNGKAVPVSFYLPISFQLH